MAFKAVAYQDALQAAGVPEAQAKAHAKAMEDFVVSEVVTKDYLEHTLTAKLAELKFELVKWIVGSAAAAGITLLLAIFRLGRV
jgi:hypothetical protein